MQQDLIERVAFAGHHGGADLAEADSVSPSGSVKDQSVADPFYVKGGALEMGFGQPAADDQFLADDHCLLVADHLEPFEPSGRASLDRDEVTALLKNGRLACQTVAPAWYPLQLTSEMPELAGQWRLMRAPAIQPGGPRIGYAWPTLIVMPKQSTLRGAAWDLMQMSLIGDGARALDAFFELVPEFIRELALGWARRMTGGSGGAFRRQTGWGDLPDDKPGRFTRDKDRHDQ